MKDESHITHEMVDWNGISISVTYDGKFLGPCKDPSNDLAHLTVQAIAPAKAPLPITSTGYKSHYVHPEEVSAYGGPKGYVLAWIAEEEVSNEWKEHVASVKQLSLF